jgi:cytoskeletal protein CcmA (bactofilin family)
LCGGRLKNGGRTPASAENEHARNTLSYDESVESVLPATEITALLGRGTHFEGKLHFEGRVRIDGGFRGEIRSPDILIIGEGAEVEAEIEVGTVIIKGGSVKANIRAAQSIELYVPAKVSGNLYSPEIFMDKGVQFSGSCTMAPLDAG